MRKSKARSCGWVDRRLRRRRVELLEDRRMLAGARPAAVDDFYSTNQDTVLRADVEPPSVETVFSDSFDAPMSPSWSMGAPQVSPAGERSYLGDFANDDLELVVDGLAPHRRLWIEFDLIIAGPWEGFGSSPSRDQWRLDQIDRGERISLIDTAFSNLFDVESATQLHPASFNDRTIPLSPPGEGSIEAESLGFDGGDSVYHFNLELPHTDERLELRFAGRALEEEAGKIWGLDDVSIRVLPTPSSASGVLANDHDRENETLEAVLESEPEYGELELLPDGRFTYRPDDGFVGLDAFSYYASDGDRLSTGGGDRDRTSTPRPTRVEIDVLATGDVGPQARHNVFSATVNTPIKMEALPVAPVEVFFDDFNETPSNAWSTQLTSIAPAGARQFLGRFGNDTVSLSLTDLQPHGSIVVELDLFIINSWDGVEAAGPDIWSLVADGDTVMQTTFSVVFQQNYPDEFGGPTHPPHTGAEEVDTLGFRDFFGTGDVYRITRTFPHAGDSLKLDFSGDGLQSLDDESWGLENVRVSLAGGSVMMDDQHVDLQSATAALTMSPSHGRVEFMPDGSFEYFPNRDFIGVDSFEYRIEQDGRVSNPGRVSISYSPPENAPARDRFAIEEGGALLLPGMESERFEAVVLRDDFSDGLSDAWINADTTATNETQDRFLGGLANDEISFSLDALPTHSWIVLDFDFLYFDSWDGDEVVTIASESDGELAKFQLRLGDSRYAPTVEVLEVQDDAMTLTAAPIGGVGDAEPFRSRGGYRVSFAFPHSASGIRMLFVGSGTEGIDNEAWGLDNVLVRTRHGILANDVLDSHTPVVRLEQLPRHGDVEAQPDRRLRVRAQSRIRRS